MSAVEVERQLREACAEVDDAVRLLETPTPGSLDCCAHLLEAAGQRIAGFQPQLQAAAGSHNARQEARRLRSSVSYASRLLEGAASLYFHWSRIRDTICAGYTPRGEPALAPIRNRISFQG